MQIEINDDFDLEKIISSGQCFRAKDIGNRTFRFITGSHVVYIQPLGDTKFSVSCHEDVWNSIWRTYFDLDCDYRTIRMEESGKHTYTDDAMEYGRGLRILRQNAWEMLITFIISQRKNIPAIRKAVEILSSRYGHPLVNVCETVYSFPTAAELLMVSVDELRECGLGYRASYIYDAIQNIARHTIDLEAIAKCDDEKLFQLLMQIRGVGKKVANCVCLFGYGRKSRVPVDVWINRVLQREFQDADFQSLFGDRAGIMQQYIFFYERSRW